MKMFPCGKNFITFGGILKVVINIFNETNFFELAKILEC